MSFTTAICNDLLPCILRHLTTNKDMKAMRCTCKYLKEHTDQYGYIRNIVFGLNSDYMNYISLYNHNRASIYMLTMDSLTDPVPWIPSRWPETMIFNNCQMGNTQINPPTSPTKILRISDFTPSHFPMLVGAPNILKINWTKLPQLREVYIRSPDMILDGMQACTHLETICIDLQNKNRPVPQWIGNFPKLKIIMINMATEGTYHFISPTLKICLIPKKTPFTSISKIVPPKHLKDNMFVSIGYPDWDMTKLLDNLVI